MARDSILLVDDEKPIHELVRVYLEKEGYHMSGAFDGEEALEKVELLNPALVVLDIMLPKLDGWAVLRSIREQGNTVPVIMLSAKGEEYDRVLGLELGADDYVAKPFSPRELVARIKAVLRRAGIREESRTLTFPGLEIDDATHRVTVYGSEVSLSPKEFELLRFLAGKPGRLYTRDQLLAGVWGYDYFGDPRTVDTHIKRIREKLRNPQGTNYIRTVWGLGYKFEVTE
ncbi:response regulator transcription factor [Desulforudis sp. 1088]|uniref:response regulator transcription factor n=1 Tax=unclassified Candidatus Desulforudis TaxID=2635950 RepID=UPI003489DA68